MKLLLSIFASLCFFSCAHIESPLVEHVLPAEIKSSTYNIIKNALLEAKAVELKECNCMAAFHRDLFGEPDGSARYVFDQKVSENARQLGTKNSMAVLAIGSGLLLNELTAIANILAQKKNVKIYLTDWAYLFYGENNFQERALVLGKNPDSLPEGYKEFYFWEWAKKKDKDWPFIPFFEMHHRAIDQFKAAIAYMDKIYGTNSSVEIIKPVADHAVDLPALDMIISIDSFIDIPVLIKILHYQFKLTKNPVRFISLNKTKSLGGFWDSSPGKEIEEAQKKPVVIEVYKVTSLKGSEAYTLLERSEHAASAAQIERMRKRKSVPRRDSTESPLEGLKL